MIGTTPDLVGALVLGYLSKYSQGRPAARTQGRIAADLWALGLAVNARGIRDALGVLAEAGWPVGTTSGRPAGAFLCVTSRDFRIAYRNLVWRIRRQARRARRFKAAAREILSGQKRLDFGEAREAFADLERAPLLAGLGAEPVPAEGDVG